MHTLDHIKISHFGDVHGNTGLATHAQWPPLGLVSAGQRGL
jgi:hypothetical protein